MKAGIFAAALAMAATGCSMNQEEFRSSQAVAGPAVQEVTEAQNGSTIVLPRGGELIVALKGNRTTGYYWQVKDRPAFLSAPAELYVQDPAAPGMVGVGGTERFTFRAIGAGRGTLRLDQVGAGGRGVAERWRAEVVVR
jgi:predicted secreted protein